MGLRDQVQTALDATPAENVRRRDLLRSVLDTAAGDGDAEIKQAIAKAIAAHEQTAVTYGLAGNPDLAAAERHEIDALRAVLRHAAEEQESGKPAPVAPAPGASSGTSAPRPLISRIQMIIGGVTVVAIAAAAVALYAFRTPVPDPAVANGAAPVTAFQDDRTMGNPKAPVTLLEYAAPTCPFCARFMLTVMPEIKRDYIDKGKVFYIFRVFPLQPADGAVEGIARCLPKERYFPYLERMFRNQPQWDPDGYKIPDVHGAIVRLARVEGVDAARADRCMNDAKQLERINQIAQDGLVRYNIRGTPTLIINGQVFDLVGGSDPAKALRLRIDSLLAKS